MLAAIGRDGSIKAFPQGSKILRVFCDPFGT